MTINVHPPPGLHRQAKTITGGTALRILLALLFAMPGVQATAQKAEIVESLPAMRAREVDPLTTEIRITFDKPIRESGVPFCGEKQFLPTVTGEPNFPDEFTIVWPVQLEPEHTYRMVLHCEDEEYAYRGKGQEPERPVQLFFTTGPTAGRFVPVSARNHNAWSTFREVFRNRYCYYDRIEIDWEEHFDESAAWILRAPTPAEFAQRLAILLEPAVDGHISVGVPSERLGIHTDTTPFKYNGNFAAIERAFPDFIKHNENFWSGRDGDIGYVMVGSMMNSAYQLDPLDEVMPGMLDAKVLILDLRTNGGGLDVNAKRVANWFFDRPLKFAYMRQRSEEIPSGWSHPMDQWLNGHPPDKVFRGHLIVLQGQMSASAAEWFLIMMELKEPDTVTTVGDRSMGITASPVSRDLGNGVWVNIPALMALRLDGTDFEGTGVAPEVRVDGDFTDSDPVLEKALEIAREKIAATATTEVTPSPTRKRGLHSWP